MLCVVFNSVGYSGGLIVWGGLVDYLFVLLLWGGLYLLVFVGWCVLIVFVLGFPVDTWVCWCLCARRCGWFRVVY